MDFADEREVDRARFERVFQDRGKKADDALHLAHYMDEGDELGQDIVLDLLVDLLHLFPAEESERRVPWLVEAAHVAIRQYQRERAMA